MKEAILELEVNEAAAEQLLGRKLTALDRFLGLARDRAIKLVEGNMKSRLRLLKHPQNIQDAPRRTRPRVNPVRSRVQGTDGIVELRPHLTTARSPVVQALFHQMGQGDKLVRKGLWMDMQAYLRDEKTGHFQGRKRQKYKSRDGLRFISFQERMMGIPLVGMASVAKSFRSKGSSKFTILSFWRNRQYQQLKVRTGLRAWGENSEKGTQSLRHTVRLSHPDILVKLILAPTVKFTRERVQQLFAQATKKAMEEP